MRGCLFVLILAAAVIGSIAWFASAPIAGSVVGAILEASGYRAASSTITVAADPPPRLLLGRADRLSIVSTDVEWRTMRARSLAMDIDGVDLFGRTAATVQGSITGASFDDGAGGRSPDANLDVDGPARAASAVITIDGLAVRSLLIGLVRTTFGVTATDAQLVAPNRLRLTAPGATVEGTLVVDAGGAIALQTSLGSVPMVRLDPDVPLSLRTVSVVDGNVRLEGILNVNALLGG